MGGSSWRWVISLAAAGVPLTPRPSLLLLSVSTGAERLAQTCDAARVLPLLMPISPSFSAPSSQRPHAAQPGPLQNVLPVFRCSSPPSVIRKGQLWKGSLSPPLLISECSSCPYRSFFLLLFVPSFFPVFFWPFLPSSDSMKPKATERCGCRCLRSVGERGSDWGKQMALASGVQPEEQVRVTWPPVTRAIWLLLACEWKERGAPERERARASRALCNLWQGESATLNWKWS